MTDELQDFLRNQIAQWREDAEFRLAQLLESRGSVVGLIDSLNAQALATQTQLAALDADISELLKEIQEAPGLSDVIGTAVGASVSLRVPVSLRVSL